MKCLLGFKKQLALVLLSLVTVVMPAMAGNCNHSNVNDGKCGSCGKFVMFYAANGEISYRNFENAVIDGKTAFVFSYSNFQSDELQGNNLITSVVIPNGVTHIGGGAFARCQNLKSVVVPGSVKVIDGGAFQQCPALTDLELGYGIESICGGAFAQCTSLKNLNIPGSVKSIGTQGEFGGKNTENLVLGEGVENIGYAFQNCSALVSVVIPGSVETINNHIFSNCENLKTVVISEGVTTIGQGAFSGCKNLESIVIPGSVNNIQQDAFQSCTSLTSVEFKDGVASIGDRAFQNCPIETVELPSSVSYVGVQAFDKNTTVGVTVGADGSLPQTNTAIDVKLTDASNLENLVNSASGLNNNVISSVTYVREMTPGTNWGAVCLPFVCKSDESVEFFKLAAKTAEGTLVFESVSEVGANMPCVYCKLDDSESQVEMVADDANLAVGEPLEQVVEGDGFVWTMKGSYKRYVIDAIAQRENGFEYYAVSKDRIVHAVKTITINPFRAFFELKNTSSNAAPARLEICVSEKETGLAETPSLEFEDGVLYDLSGNRVKTKAKNQVYILNGNKVMFK